VTVDGRRHRPLNPLAEQDVRLLEIVHDGVFTIHGFRNRDLRERLFAPAASAAERRRQSGQVTRKLTLLRAHGLIKKVPKTHRYVLTATGRTIIATLLAVRHATAKQLATAA
jgi:hypothetical protein